MKGMVDPFIITSNDSFHGIQLFDIQHSSLSMPLFVVDRPTQSITSITKIVQLSVSNDKTVFGNCILPLTVSIWMLKQNRLQVNQAVSYKAHNKKREWK